MQIRSTHRQFTLFTKDEGPTPTISDGSPYVAEGWPVDDGVVGIDLHLQLLFCEDIACRHVPGCHLKAELQSQKVNEETTQNVLSLLLHFILSTFCHREPCTSRDTCASRRALWALMVWISEEQHASLPRCKLSTPIAPVQKQRGVYMCTGIDKTKSAMHTLLTTSTSRCHSVRCNDTAL